MAKIGTAYAAYKKEAELASILLTDAERAYVTAHEYDEVDIYGYAVGCCEKREDREGLRLLEEVNPELFRKTTDPEMSLLLLSMASALGMATTVGEEELEKYKDTTF